MAENDALSKEQTEKLCRENLNFFSGFSIPEESIYEFPQFYITVWLFLLEQFIKIKGKNGLVFRFALGLPRGHAKTTYAKLLAAYAITYRLCDFILVVGSSEDRAQDFLADVHGILTSANFQNIYGDWRANTIRDTKEVKIAYWQGREVILVAVGAGTSLRGINIRNRRPDFILMDDVQTKENDESPTDRKRLLTWILSTLLKARSPKGCFILFIGNMYSDHCILKQLQDNRQWITLITGAILADGSALWPELHSFDNLLDEYEHDAGLGEADIWFAEIMNDPRSIHRSLIPTGKIAEPPFSADSDYDIQASFITIDPSGYRRHSDRNVCVAHQLIDDQPVIVQIEAKRFTPEETIKTAIGMAMDHRATVIAVEGTGYQQTLKFWMEMYLRHYELDDIISVLELNAGVRTKEARIRAWTKELNAENYHILRQRDRSLILFEALRYKLGERDNVDDILDCCSYGLDVINNYRDDLEFDFAYIKQHKQQSTARVIPNNTILDVRRPHG